MSLLDSELEEVTIELKELEKESDRFRKSISELKSRKVRLTQEKCKDNIGRCFKRIRMSRDNIIINTEYCKIVSTDEIHYDRMGSSFNEFQYPALWFDYPYDNSKLPFTEEKLFSGAWGKGSPLVSRDYEEINRDEYMEKFNEVNLEWISCIDNI